MTWLTAPENDYRALLDLPDVEPTLRVSVVMPVYNRVDLLARTVAGLVPQTYPAELWDVIVADDGSDEDVEAALAPLANRLPITVVRREHDGYGAGHARNLGAEASTADVLVFIDGDCLPDPELIEQHVRWHHKADNLVIIGSRHGADTSELTLEELADGSVNLKARAFGQREVPSEQLAQTDFRGVLHRRTASMRHGEEAFRSLVSSNFSIRRDRFTESGGFDEEFRRWGGEDTELGWRLYMRGMFFAPEDRAVCYHQLQEDTWGDTGRQDSKTLNAGIIANKIPHPFYREYKRGRIWENPRVSWIVLPADGRHPSEIWDQLLTHTRTDWEALFLADDGATSLLAEHNVADPRFRIVAAQESKQEQILAAVSEASGEYLAILNGWASLDPSLLGKALRRLDRTPRFGRVTVGYQVPIGDHVERYLHPRDTADLDVAWQSAGLPAFSLIRRRDWNKASADNPSLPQLWAALESLTRVAHISEPLIGLPARNPGDPLPDTLAPIVGDRRLLLDDLRASGPSVKSARSLLEFSTAKVRKKPYGAGWPVQASAQGRAADRSSTSVAIRYVGWTGHENLGDEALLQAIGELLPWADVKTRGAGNLLLLGGGTLINRFEYLEWLRSQDSPRIERAVFGTGVANPEYWGIRESTDDWIEFLNTCAFVGVRGPLSEKTLRKWGYRGQLEVIGDPALHLSAPNKERVDGRVVVSPAWTGGELWGKDDQVVFRGLSDLIAQLRSEGRDVHMLSCFPADDRHIIQIMRDAGFPEMPYLAGYENIDASLDLLASADLVVAERLHAAVLSAAVETPFVGLEYRPKILDFAESVDQAQHVIRTDNITSDNLGAAVVEIDAHRTEISESLRDTVGTYRTRLVAASQQLAEVMTK